MYDINDEEIIENNNSYNFINCVFLFFIIIIIIFLIGYFILYIYLIKSI